jgi:hypothetical protein
MNSFSKQQERIVHEAKRVLASYNNLAGEVQQAKAALRETKELAGILESHKFALERIIKEKTIAFPWLAKAFADYYALCEERVARTLERKSRPAYKSAEAVRDAKARRRQAELELKVAEYKVAYYESLFPWLADLLDESAEELVSANSEFDDSIADDSVRKWLTESEYASLNPSKRSQLALDRYCGSRKTKWQIGRDYERYIGFLFESEGYRVEYKGAVDGFDDLGRDLIVKRGRHVKIVQCKCWSKHKLIHEKHVFQLYGSTIEYQVDNDVADSAISEGLLFGNGTLSVSGELVVSNSLSDRARKFARRLNLSVRESVLLCDYPRIKCNISASGERIYHLPMDQQYDRVVISLDKGESYATTVEEAESKGFRRAFRWTGAHGA